MDVTGAGQWLKYLSFQVRREGEVCYEFPEDFEAYWVRLVARESGVLTAEFDYR